MERACVEHMRKTRRHTHGRLGRSDIVAEGRRVVVSGSARRLQRRAHGGNSSADWTTDARGVGCQLHRDNGIVVGRRARVDYDDDDTCILECRVTDGGWPRLGAFASPKRCLEG